MRSHSRRSLELNYHVAPTSSKEPEKISSNAEFAGSSNTRPLPASIPLGPYHEPIPQLSERDSIFATNYLTSDSNSTTPRLPPTTQDSKNDLAQDVAPSFELPAPLVLSTRDVPSLPHHANSPASITSPFNLTNQLSRQSSEHTRTFLPLRQTNGVNGIKSRDTTIPVEGSRAQQAKPSNPVSGALEEHRQLGSKTQPAYPLKRSITWAPPKSQASTTAAGMEMTANDREEKSRTDKGSKSGKENAEHQIEAKLANEEPISNARSRKASHYLGLFKENTGTQEQKKGRDKSKEDTKFAKSEHEVELKHDESLGSQNTTASKRRGDVELTAQPTDRQHLAHAVKPDRPETSRQLSASKASRRSDIHAEEDQKPEPQECHDLEGKDARIEWRSGSPARGTLPLRLLEEIRNHRHLPSRQRRASRQKSPAKSVEDDAMNRNDSVTALQNQSPEREQGSSDEDLKAENGEDDDEFESDKEHISSATYYPHHTPPNALNEHELDQTELLDEQVASPEQLEPQTISLDEVGEDIIHVSKDSALSLQSKSKVHQIQKDYQKSQPSSDYDDAKHSSTCSTVSYVSDTDYESRDARSELGDESGVTDRGDLTPTATPTAKRNLHSHMRNAPLGAVELKPYKHQVGGHTKVFSFSKQAICKQLNNRENEFYEVVESQHPELLRFLPKYVMMIFDLFIKNHGPRCDFRDIVSELANLIR